VPSKEGGGKVQRSEPDHSSHKDGRSKGRGEEPQGAPTSPLHDTLGDPPRERWQVSATTTVGVDMQKEKEHIELGRGKMGKKEARQ